MTDIARKRGDTYPEIWLVTDVATGLPVDITGASFRLTVDQRQAPPNASTKLWHVDGTIVSPAANGRVQFPLTVEQAASTGAFWYDLQMTDASGYIRTIDAGAWVVTDDITK